MRSVKIAALIETVSPSSSLSMKRKKEDNESENYYTPPCLPSQLRQKSIGIIRRSLSENITPNKGFKKPRMLSDSGTPLSTRNQISPPVKETVKTLVVKPVDDTPAVELSNDTEPINDHRLPQSSPEHLPRQIFQSQSHSQLQPQPARQSQSQPEAQIQIPTKVVAQPKQNLQPQLQSQPQPQPQPQPKPQPKPKIQVPIKATPQPQLSQHQPLSQPKPLASTSVTQLQNSQYQSEPTQEEDEDDIKAEPVPSGFKLASNKVLFLNHVAQKRVAYLTKQLQDMNIDLSVYKADKDKKGPVAPISCPIENILNNSKSINCPDADDEICNSADDEFLRNLDVNNLVGKEGVF